jgi:ATP-dependent DNA helicase RecG
VSTTDTVKFAEAICAFANDLPKHGAPGYLVIGVDDSRRFAGLTVTDTLMQTLGGLRSDGNIQPLPELRVEKVVTSEGEAAVVIVQPSPLSPVRYRGRVCIRVGALPAYAARPRNGA